MLNDPKNPFYRLMHNQMGAPDTRHKRHHEAELSLLKAVTAGNAAGLLSTFGMIGASVSKAGTYPLELWLLFVIFLAGVGAGVLGYFAESEAARAAATMADEEAAAELMRQALPTERPTDPAFAIGVTRKVVAHRGWSKVRTWARRVSFVIMMTGIAVALWYLFTLIK